MERKKTELEQFLIKYGFKLIGKTYRGNKSQFTDYYMFSKDIGFHTIRVGLNQKRNKVVEIRLITLSNVLDLERAYEINNILAATNELLDDFEKGVQEHSEFVKKIWNLD